MTYEDLHDKTKENFPGQDLDMLRLAYEYAVDAHRGQQRLNGEEYMQHVLATAIKLAEMKIDVPTVIAGLLHDVPEDTAKTLEDIKENFGAEIHTLVAGITKLGKIKYRGLERYAENLRKMFVAMAEDLRVIFIKFADRINNLQTLDALPPVKQQRVARESLEIYAPIAQRLGMWQLRGELEDLAFPYVFPGEYKWVKKISEERIRAHNKYLVGVKEKVNKEIASANVRAIEVVGRTKQYYSLYQKLLRKDKDIDKVYDIAAIRIIVGDIKDCYHILGLIHNIWKPMPGRVKDYIAQPKPNGYQSLHTSVFAEGGRVVEFQIRTMEMNELAEVGVAAHWRYKEKDNSKNRKLELPANQLKWIKELIDIQTDTPKSEDYLDQLKIDVFQNRIFVLTPKGDVIDLPEDSTPVDFAYHIHTELGDHCGASRVNEKIAALDTKLKSGDLVEIVPDKNRHGPSEDWLKFVKTHMARNKIKAFLRHETKNKIMQFFTRR
jgi:GTP diphosphokinase / guanosine-3',5'-bis(diphosphate) 3'-diphosphatase